MYFPGLDPHRDSPVEVLHTISLGQFRYLWFLTTGKWNKAKDQKFIAWLGGSNVDGLAGIPHGVQARYLINYRNNLVGKHFKWISQLATFNLHWDGCDPTIFDLWKATGELGALVWCTKILDMDQYAVRLIVCAVRPPAHDHHLRDYHLPQSDLDVAVANVLDVWAKVDPNRITVKLKLHVLTHLQEDVRRFGPPALYEAEAFEASNQPFRQCSILSNHHAPSRDIATTMARMERFKHIISGGWWWDKVTRQHVQAGKRIIKDFNSNPLLQSHLGWTPDKQRSPGNSLAVCHSRHSFFVGTRFNHLHPKRQSTKQPHMGLAFRWRSTGTSEWDRRRNTVQTWQIRHLKV